MKTVWIVVGVIVGCALLCCGGVFIFGSNVYRGAVATSEDANKFAAEIAREYGAKWDPAVLRAKGDRAFSEQVPDDELKVLSETLSKKLGPVKEVGAFSMDGINVRNVNGESFTEIDTKALAKFEKGDGTIEITVIKRGDKLGVLAFNVKSAALLK